MLKAFPAEPLPHFLAPRTRQKNLAVQTFNKRWFSGQVFSRALGGLKEVNMSLGRELSPQPYSGYCLLVGLDVEASTIEAAQVAIVIGRRRPFEQAAKPTAQRPG